ncbi:MAG: T9SS type A sorting domain-containing protein [Bacteroidetes bacterium]|jgi:PKD repeat protein|nr:T9SS type A sorting domain-containing protein [Bacteroidota bacterium]MBT6687223.1 T9SS type A sorting domain-containing protein [Bacteroidota bacterium]MBT7144588.1 T9SS type A sorting domain-containing protein [Bacteroidota bacterium]MBT7490788.1 T9SS type A sorting domain-containing protein [Bacteroidota bacterium]
MKRFLIFLSVLYITSFSANSQTPLTTAVDFNVTDINGFQLNLFNYLNSGNFVVIYFFTSGNPQSQDSVSYINQSYTDFGCNDGNVLFFAINWGENDADVQQFVFNYGIEYPTVSGINGGGNIVVSEYGIGITSFPTAILIAPDHSIIEQDLVISNSTQTIVENGGITQTCVDLISDFSGNILEFVVGGSVDFADLSNPLPEGWEWTFDGATPQNSNDQNPTNITYSSLGYFSVKLIVTKGFQIDSIIKIDYIHVVDSAPPIPIFLASDSSIMEGDTVFFTDLSSFNPTSWFWSFEGGVPSSFEGQFPPEIIYYNHGAYDVSLTVANSHGTNYLIKEDYIKVSEEIPIPEMCDTLSNCSPYDSLMTLEVQPWGLIPGHNGLGINEYADLFVNTENYEYVSGLIVPVAISSYNYSTSKVRFKIYDGDTIPGELLGYKDVYLSQMTSNFYHHFHFDNDVPVSGDFFVGYEIYYIEGDNFATSMADNRGEGEFNTLFIRSSTNWIRLTDFSLFEDFNSSLAIKPITCKVVYQEEIENVLQEINVFPNPTNDIATISFDKETDINLKVFNSLGKFVFSKNIKNAHQIDIDFSNNPPGLYFVNIVSEDISVTKKIIVL